MNLKPRKRIYSWLFLSIVYIANMVIQFISSTKNGVSDALVAFYFVSGIVVLSLFVISCLELVTKNNRIIRVKLISKHNHSIYVLRNDGKLKKYHIFEYDVLNKLEPGQELSITVSSITAMPYHIQSIEVSKQEPLSTLAVQYKKIGSYSAWANLRVIDSIRSSSELQLEKPISLLNHIVAAEKIWLARIKGESTSAIAIWPAYTLEQCEQMAMENKDGYTALLNRLQDSDFCSEITYFNSQGQSFSTTIMDILAHVSLHGSYHRGQIATLLKQAGGIPVNTDYITYVRQI
ncbi:putative damage-inducible protein DinB [Paenibacillus endophyticus]|uniref:Putative damage-inducible protein DinB n=1 Tax=Paenibacillus endophyticus TaxID=1294268 RepID=A0A7W5C776_9BACL|nr:DinB family protein [Paenibacillus endophyticus]MBB3151949.1 putative damage-inducible protein DinB [Paenibacillus endophyticus]